MPANDGRPESAEVDECRMRVSGHCIDIIGAAPQGRAETEEIKPRKDTPCDAGAGPSYVPADANGGELDLRENLTHYAQERMNGCASMETRKSSEKSHGAATRAWCGVRIFSKKAKTGRIPRPLIYMRPEDARSLQDPFDTTSPAIPSAAWMRPFARSREGGVSFHSDEGSGTMVMFAGTSLRAFAQCGSPWDEKRNIAR